MYASHAVPSHTPASSITSRSPNSTSLSTSSTDHDLCIELDAGKLVIDRKTLIIAISICVVVTCVSALCFAILLYREWSRRRDIKQAKIRRCKSLLGDRVSGMRKGDDDDDEYWRQHDKCFQHESGSQYAGSPISGGLAELMQPERLCEVPAVPPKQTTERSTAEDRSGRNPLLPDERAGYRMQARR